MLNKKKIAEYIRPISTIPTSLRPKGRIQARIQSVFFDLYGTLFISASGDIGTVRKEFQQVKRLEELFEKYSIPKSPQSVLKEFYRSIERNHQILRNKDIDFPEIEIDRIWMDILKISDPETIKDFAVEFELIVNPVYPMPHLKELLAAIKRANRMMGIISNAQFFTPYLFRWMLGSAPEGLGFHPDLIFYSYRYGYAKPSGFLFDLAVEKLLEFNISTDEVLYVGNDMLNDIYPAKAKGFKTALFAGDRRSLRLRQDDVRCKNLSADIIITDLIQLLEQVDINNEQV